MKHPEITVLLTGEDGNAFVVLAKVTRALREHGVPDEEIKQFREEAMSGDYFNLLRTCMEWVDVE